MDGRGRTVCSKPPPLTRVKPESDDLADMNDARWYLVCYDVRDSDRLRRAAKHLEGYGDRVQYSVFRCWMTRAQMERLRWELTDMLALEDDVLVIPLCARCVRAIRVTHETAKRVDWPAEPPSHRIV
jgi:CRISPR-associated protein Cas2